MEIKIKIDTSLKMIHDYTFFVKPQMKLTGLIINKNIEEKKFTWHSKFEFLTLKESKTMFLCFVE